MEKSNPPPSPIGLEPAPKKQKMSTTTTSDDEEFDPAVPAADGGAPPERKPKYKRRKVAIFFAYCGVGYQGMQKNPGAKTIEGDLEEALFRAGAVPEQDRGQPRRYDWARSARTDKGVSAVGQVISGRFYVDPPGFIDRMNSNLSPQIRIFGYKRATASFNAKKFCDKRRYVYLIPVFALDPSAHRDRESVLASMGSGNELVKCVECSERGRKVEGVMGKRSFDSKNEPNGASSDSGILSNTKNSPLHSVENGDDASHPSSKTDKKLEGASSDSGILSNTKNPPLHSVENGDDASYPSSETDKKLESFTPQEESDEATDMEGAKGNDKDTLATKKTEFSYGDLEKDKFNRILKYYEGTHNFHNFTTRIKAEDPSAKRYIISFAANTIVNVDGIDFVKCEVVGQSFMLHQIRKMIGLAVAIMRNCSPELLIQTAFRKDVNINVPMAPEVGLYLDECFFTSYNRKWEDHEELSMKDYAGEAEDFKMKHIYTHIASTEHKEGVMGLWLHSLNYRNYPDLAFSEHEKTVDMKSDEAANMKNGAEIGSCDVKSEVSVNGNTTAVGDDVARPCHVNKAEESDIKAVQPAGIVDSLPGKTAISANVETA